MHSNYILVEWQEWTKDQRHIHDYIPFNYEDLLLKGREDVLSRYEDCLYQFKKLSIDRQKKGLIYGGVQFDFCFVLKEKDNA